MNATLPETIGDFRILSKLGQGGMGAVYRAVHGTLERPVALKILPAEFANNPEYVTRFLREARTIATLSHKNVVQVYDAGEKNGQYYIAMELIEGQSVLQYAEKNKVGQTETLDLLLQAARGLSAAHEKGLVHRDIKPENMLVGNDGTLHIVDFGLVMESSSTTQLTATGACLGTPMYMSPEQADGEQADARTDIYSLGISFFRIFTGHTPFTSPTVMNLLFKHKFEAPPHPQKLRADLSPDICNLLLRMIAKKREDRPQSATELVRLIEGVRDGEHIPEPAPFVPALDNGFTPTLVNSTPLGTAAPVRAQPRRLMIFAAAGMLCVGLLVLAVARGGGTPRDATEPKINEGALGDSAFVAGRFKEALQHYRAASTSDALNPLWREKAGRTERLISFNARMEAAEQLASGGDFDGAIREYSGAIEFDDGSAAKDRLEAVKTRAIEAGKFSAKQRAEERDRLNALGEQAERAKNWSQAAEYFARAANLSESAVRSAFADRSAECRRQSYVEKGLAAENQRNFTEAENWYKKAQAVKFDPAVSKQLESAQRAQHPEAASASAFETAMGEGDAAIKAGNFTEARSKFGAAIGLKPDSAVAADKLKEVDGRETMQRGDALRAAGKTQDAIALYNEAVAKCPALAAETNVRLKLIQGAQPKGAGVLVAVDIDVRAEKDAAALAAASEALREDSENATFKNVKAALESLIAAGAIQAEMQKLVDGALEKISDARDEDDDERNGEQRSLYQGLRIKYKDHLARARRAFLEHNYYTVQSAAKEAHDDCTSLGSQLSQSAEYFDKRAEKSAEKVGVKLPIFTVGIGGDKGKAGKYRKIAESFRTLSARALDLKK